MIIVESLWEVQADCNKVSLYFFLGRNVAWERLVSHHGLCGSSGRTCEDTLGWLTGFIGKLEEESLKAQQDSIGSFLQRRIGHDAWILES